MYTGNMHSPRGAQSGSGRVGMRTPQGRLSVTGKENDVKFVSVTDLISINNPGTLIAAQSVGGAVAIEVTLAPPDLAFNPLQTDIWVESTPVTVTALVTLPMCSALKITFTEAATVYLMGV